MLRLGRKYPKLWWVWHNTVISDVHGEAEWMSDADKRKHWSPSNDGLWLSENWRLTQRQSFEHVQLVGPSGKGKSSNFIINNILACLGSYVVTDLKGELFEKTSGYMAEQGYRVKVLDLMTIGKGHHYNPCLHRIGDHGLRQLALDLLEPTSGGNDPMWAIQAITPLYAVLVTLNRIGGEYNNLANARWLINHDGPGGGELAKVIAANVDDLLWAEYRGFLNQDEKTKQGTLLNVKAALEPWSDPVIAEVTAADTLGLKDLRNEKTIIYIKVPPGDVRSKGGLLNLMYGDCFDLCARQADGLPVWFIMDEFGNCPPIRNFTDRISTIRSNRCSAMMALQNLSQLRKEYGKEGAETIESNCQTKIFMRSLHHDTAKLVSEMTGENTVYDNAIGGAAENSRTIGVPLIRCDEVRMLPLGKNIVISDNLRPAQVTTRPASWVPMWKRCMRPAAEIETQKAAQLKLLDMSVYPGIETSDAQQFINEVGQSISGYVTAGQLT